MRSLVHKSFAQVMQTGAIRLFKSYRPEYGNGEQKRDFLYVKDAVEMTLHLAANPRATGIFNIGSGHPHTWNELARAVFSALGRPPRIEYIEMPEEIRESINTLPKRTSKNCWAWATQNRLPSSTTPFAITWSITLCRATPLAREQSEARSYTGLRGLCIRRFDLHAGPNADQVAPGGFGTQKEHPNGSGMW